MLMGRRYITSALLIALCVVVATGCRRKGSRRTVVNQGGGEIFVTDSFPGAAVQAGNVGDDQRALSNAGHSVNGGVRAFFNGDRDIAMVVYGTGSSGFSGNPTSAYISYYNGSFTSPVLLTSAIDLIRAGAGDDGFGGSSTNVINDMTVAWVNTENHASDLARDRNGDAIVHWTGRDFASGGADGNNDHLYSTYFDVTRFESVGLRHGFQQWALKVSTDDEGGENVDVHGLVSDGLCGEARWAFNGNRFEWGDDTTHIVAFWRQFINNTVAFDPTTLWVRYPLDQAGAPEVELIPTLPDEVDLLTFGASDTGIDSHETQIDSNYISYNFTIFQHVASDDTASPFFPGAGGNPGADDDVTIQTATFNSTGTDFLGTDTVQTTTPDSTDTDENGADYIQTNNNFLGTKSTFGPDEGILEIVFLHTQLDEEPTGSYAGNALNSGDLVLSQIDPTTGGVIGQAFLDLEQTLIFSDQVFPQNVDVRMGRNGDYLFIAWTEVVDSGASDENGLWVSHYRTSRDATVGISAIGGVVAGPANVNGDIDGDPVNGWVFQTQLEYVCGQQSDPEVMNIVYEQSDGTYDEINLVRMTADLTAGTAAFTFSDTFLQTDDDNGVLNSTHGASFNNYDSTDAGDNGDVLIVFRRDVDTATSNDIQLFAQRTGLGAGTSEIDSFNLFQTPAGYTLVGTPTRGDIADFDPVDEPGERLSPNEVVHILFFETEVTEFLSGNINAFRTRSFLTGDAGAGSFSTRFVPDLALDPFQLSLQSGASVSGSFLVSTATHGNNTCVWFNQDRHLYYQEYSGDGDSDPDDDSINWLVQGDNNDQDVIYTNPALIDDDSAVEVNSQFFFTRVCTCDRCDGAMILWLKVLDNSSGNNRLQVRVRTEGSNN